jgi:hypothetical protein
MGSMEVLPPEVKRSGKYFRVYEKYFKRSKNSGKYFFFSSLLSMDRY